MKKHLVAVLSVFSALTHAGLQVDVSPSPITVGETFQLTLVQDNPSSGGVPNLSSLQKDFVLVGTERQMNYSLVNGHSQSTGQWIISLQPKRAGSLFIPALKIGLDQSAPMTIEVHAGTKPKPRAQQTPGDAQVNLVTEVDEKKPYVNQQIIYTVKLYNRKRFLGANYQEPEVADALLIPLGDAKRYQTTLNNDEYAVEEQDYAIFPQKSGILTIHSPVFSALLYDINPQRIKAQDNNTELKVQPIPQNYSEKAWLPAQQINLSEQYENTAQSLNQGSTLNRTLVFEGLGIPAQLLPKLQFNGTDSYNIYPEKSQETNEVKQGQLLGRVEMKITYLFKKAGKVTLPELRVPWFNTKTGEKEVAVLPPRSFEILQSSHENRPLSKPKIDLKTKEEQSKTPMSEPNPWGWISAAILACVWVVTLLLWLRDRHPKPVDSRSHKKILEELNRACIKGDPSAARDALLQWANLRWPHASILNLGDLNQFIPDPLLKRQLHDLSQVLYQNKTQALWRGDELWRSIQTVDQSKITLTKKQNPLPPINPL